MHEHNFEENQNPRESADIKPENVSVTEEQLKELTGRFYYSSYNPKQGELAWQGALEELEAKPTLEALEEYIRDNKQILATTEDVEKISEQFSDEQILEIGQLFYTLDDLDKFAGGRNGYIRYLRWNLQNIINSHGLGSLEADTVTGGYKLYYVGRNTESEKQEVLDKLNIDPAAVKGLEQLLDHFSKIGEMVEQIDKQRIEAAKPSLSMSSMLGDRLGLKRLDQILSRLLNEKGFFIDIRQPTSNFLSYLRNSGESLEKIFQKAKELGV
jgi:hypothetical protein